MKFFTSGTAAECDVDKKARFVACCRFLEELEKQISRDPQLSIFTEKQLYGIAAVGTYEHCNKLLELTRVRENVDIQETIQRLQTLKLIARDPMSP